MSRKLILIGASTGGPGHLKKILGSLDSSFQTPIIIAQHMNQTFIESFVKQFDNELPLNVSMVDNSHIIESNNIYICSKHCEFVEKNYEVELNCVDNVDSYYNPSVDHIFGSAVPLTQKYDILAVLLTGIGHDGAQALSDLYDVGATCIAESESSAIVYGMPKRAVEINPSVKSLDLVSIIEEIKRFGDF